MQAGDRVYNRYIPQQDGSFRKKQEPDQSRPAPSGQRPHPSPAPPVPEGQPRPPVHEPQPPIIGNIGGFLRRLIPKDFDTGDLIVVLLLLLMAGDKPEDKSTALLTLALYCFL